MNKTELLVSVIATFAASGAGALAGGWLTLTAAKKQTQAMADVSEKERAAQSEQTRQDREEQAKAAVRERALDAAMEIRERLVDLMVFIPILHALREHKLPSGATPVTPMQERNEQIRSAYDSFKRSQRTNLLMVDDEQLASMYRSMAVLAQDLAYALETSGAIWNRALEDVNNYAKYLLLSLNYFIDGKPLPQHAEPPVLRRAEEDGSSWLPAEMPDHWEHL